MAPLVGRTTFWSDPASLAPPVASSWYSGMESDHSSGPVAKTVGDGPATPVDCVGDGQRIPESIGDRNELPVALAESVDQTRRKVDLVGALPGPRESGAAPEVPQAEVLRVPDIEDPWVVIRSAGDQGLVEDRPPAVGGQIERDVLLVAEL